MKVITYEEWLKNPTPRMMWVWDSNPEKAIKRKVIYFIGKSVVYPVISIPEDETEVVTKFKHCAEIAKTRRMTNKELSRWLREKYTREWKYKDGISVYGYYGYEEKCVNEEVINSILIREDDSDWKEPLVEE